MNIMVLQFIPCEYVNEQGIKNHMLRPTQGSLGYQLLKDQLSDFYTLVHNIIDINPTLEIHCYNTKMNPHFWNALSTPKALPNI